MLTELHVKNLATIDELRLELGKGVTVLSGDEGAGKSLLVDALCLLTGGRGSASLIRTGTSTALAEGVFGIDPSDSALAALLNEAGIETESDGTLILTREVQEQGKGIARVNRRAVPVSFLRQLGQYLIDIHSQMEHLSLLNPQRQIDLLDSFGGLLELRRELAGKIAELRVKAQELKTLSEKHPPGQRDLLEYQVAEIDSINIRPGEDEALQQEWQALQRAGELKEACYTAYRILYEDDHSAAGMARQAMKALQAVVSVAPALSTHIDILESVAIQLEDAGQGLNHYGESIEDSPSRFREVEKRLELLHHVKQKYGATLESVLLFADEARKELLALDSRQDLQRRAQDEYQKLKTEVGALAEDLSRAREKTSCKLAGQVNAELAELGMPRASFDIKLTREQSPDGLPAFQNIYAFTQNGIDRVQFLASTNPSEPLKPLVFIASGGETCRFMLALKTALRQADSVPTLVFDEIDAGIGGRNAQTVGRKLAALAENRQVICITHLPQVACFGNNHYRVIKDVSSGRATTSVECLKREDRVLELAAMLGDTNEAMLASAQTLLKSARRKTSREPVPVSAGG